MKIVYIDLVKQWLSKDNWALFVKKIYYQYNYELEYTKLYRNTGTFMYKVYGKSDCLAWIYLAWIYVGCLGFVLN